MHEAVRGSLEGTAGPGCKHRSVVATRAILTVVAIAAAATTASFSSARADEPKNRAYWARWETKGLPAGSDSRLRAAVSKGVMRGGWEVVAKGWKSGCKDRECFRKKAMGRAAAWSVEIYLEVVGESYGAKVVIYHSLAADRQVEVKKVCDICTIAEASRMVEQACADAVARAQAIRGSSGDEPAESSSDANKDDRAQAGSRPTEGGGEPTDVELHRKRGRRAAVLRGVGWVAGGAALLGIVPGAVLLSLHGKGTCSGGGECPRVYDTRIGGIAALAAGGACLATAVTLYLMGVFSDRPAPERGQKAAPRKAASWTVTVVPSATGVSFGVAGEL